MDVLRCALVRRRGLVLASSQAEPACWKGEVFDDETGLEEALSSDPPWLGGGEEESQEDEEGEEDDEEGNEEDEAAAATAAAAAAAAEQEVEVGPAADGAALLVATPTVGLAAGGVAELAAGYLWEGDADMGPLKLGDVGVVDEFDPADDMYAVTFNGLQWW